jgi:predicted RNA binding protein YcfA (HicA-like mRNA interferase family)
VNGRQLKMRLEEHGWVLDRISGSHHIMIKEDCRSIPIPIHGTTDLPTGIVNAILKQAAIKEKQPCCNIRQK